MAGLILKVLAHRPDLAQAVLQEVPSVIPDPEHWPGREEAATQTPPSERAWTSTVNDPSLK